ncbi:hypothetical protein D187_008685 [Cystobacter fuscus DSM 2262]|uniref:Uncharacterized protein n=1 Tax=Cystobacter fuscus (strain ATCC 25194 / DSM 2262 / NBRC 100088 / M29) TaxID=1242864 RepID=S9PJA4_CYSF2|nr:hypothetical protein D187_008685 [Cystobacter fuscus DSM 2262]
MVVGVGEHSGSGRAKWSRQFFGRASGATGSIRQKQAGN